MGYSLGVKSLAKLNTVDVRLQAVVKRAIELSKLDFSVTDGLRTAEQQQVLYKRVHPPRMATLRSQSISLALLLT